MNKAESNKLADKVVLVTRPRHQQAELVQLLEQHGARALLLPSIDIQPLALTQPLRELFGAPQVFDLIIFVSANAVLYTYKLLEQLKLPLTLGNTPIAVIGAATRRAAQQAGFDVSLVPVSGYNTEALLALDEFQQHSLSSKSVLIIRGAGGLEDLSNSLQLRGASVTYAEVYRRSIPQQDRQISRHDLSKNWQDYAITTITATSNEALQNLYDMLETPGRDAMLHTNLVVPSNRCYRLALNLGFESITIAESATNQQMVDAIIKLSNGK